MTDVATRNKWDKASKTFDFMSGEGPEKRWASSKRKLFANMNGKVLFLAIGTGLDIPVFPDNQDITGIDISPGMLGYAKPRAEQYNGTLQLMEMDVHEMTFANDSFDQVFTSCTFCSVPGPVEALQQLKRVLKPGGGLYMFEHTGSCYFPINIMLHFMTVLSRMVGPDMNRHTVNNVSEAGFDILEVNHVYLDIVKTIKARKPLS